MKTKKLCLFILPLAFLFSCEKESINKNNIPDISGNPSIVSMVMNESFKLDFPAKKDEREIGTKPSNILFKHKGIKSLSYEEFLKVYPKLKKEILIANKEKDQSPEIQTLALWMLRYHFLEASSKESITESQFLLNLLIENEAIDLDVLVDVFIKVEGVMDTVERKRSINYLKNLYATINEGLIEKFKKAEQKYKDSTDKTKSLFYGKYLERQSKSLSYSRNIRPDIFQPTNH